MHDSTHESLCDKFTTIQDIISDKICKGELVVAGWIMSKRDSKNRSFIMINDGSSATPLQIILESNVSDYNTLLPQLTLGSSIGVSGELVRSQGREQQYEIIAKTVEIFGQASPSQYPLQKKEITYEYLRTITHLRPRTETFRSIFRIRSSVSLIIHDFFRSRNFHYVHSPIISSSECEVGTPFQVTTLDPTKMTSNLKNVDYEHDFFKSKALLSGSGQLQGELLALALGKIYTFAPCFRAEESNTARHLAEFWQIEPEMAFYNLHDTINLAEDLIRYVLKRYLDECKTDLEVLVRRNGVDPRQKLELSLTKPLVRIDYAEAIKILLKAPKSFGFPVKWGLDLQTEHERYLCEEIFSSPVAIYNYPEGIKSFYMYLNDDEKTVRGADLLTPGVGEIIGSSQREHRYSVLEERMRNKGMSVDSYQWFLDTRRFGSVPHSGFGMGLERMLMWLTGMSNIRDVIPFPRASGECDI